MWRYYIQIKCLKDCDTAQAVIHQFLIVEARYQFQVSPSAISGGQCDNSTDFPPCTLIFLPKHHFTNVSYPFIHLAIMLYSPNN